MNTELKRAAEMMSARFPNMWICVENSIMGNHGKREAFRFSVIDEHDNCHGANGNTVDEAFANVVKEYEKPRTEEINRAKSLLESNGYKIESQAATL